MNNIYNHGLYLLYRGRILVYSRDERCHEKIKTCNEQTQ